MSTFKTMDGCTAVAHSAYALSEVSTIYPITPSTDIGETVDAWSSQNKLNIFGETVVVREMQSEAGAAGAMHGALLGGSLASTFTASQGLLLMIPNIYKMAGELLPGVFHVAARSIAAQALSIFGDHQDVMAIRQTGIALLASSSVQEAMDMAIIAHLAAIDGSLPFCHFFDGFRTSHEINKIAVVDYDTIRSLVDYENIKYFKSRSLNPSNPRQYGTAQNPDVYFQSKEAANVYYKELPHIVLQCMKRFAEATGRRYNLFDYYGSPTATRVIISMGSSCEAIEETIDAMNAQGANVGLVKVRLYRPFDAKALFSVLPSTAEIVTVLDRTKEPGSLGEPLYLDVVAAATELNIPIQVVAGRYGLSSKDFTPEMITAVFANMDASVPKNHFTVGIEDDLTYTSLEVKPDLTPSTIAEDVIACKLIGIGSDGTVGANKQAIKIIGDYTDMYAQGYFQYDSKKSGGFTVSHLRFSKNKIRSTYLVNAADYVACHKPSYVRQYDVLDGIKEGGTFVLNAPWSTADVLERELPPAMLRIIASKKVKLYTIDAVRIAMEAGLGSRINMVMQTVFFKLTNVLPLEEALSRLKDSVKKAYGEKGDEVVAMNIKAIDKALENLMTIQYPDTWATVKDGETAFIEYEDQNYDDFVRNYVAPINRQKGDLLPVSLMSPDGSMPLGTSSSEKRKIAVMIPKWIEENCIQCNQCSLICPHATIRPFLATEEELSDKPASFSTIKAVGKNMDGLQYRIQVYPEDCLGCSVCVDVCPGKKDEKALVMTPIEEIFEAEKCNVTFAENNLEYKTPEKRDSIKGSQFYQPLLEFSGACAGCGETPYAKLLTQLFGEDMIIANATGCSSIWGASSPSVPYTTNMFGEGPAWANSLFEDAAEFGYGMLLAHLSRRKQFIRNVELLLTMEINEEVRKFFTEWLAVKDDREQTKAMFNAFHERLAEHIDYNNAFLLSIVENIDLLKKRVIWILGGDGWAYDIGYGGLDHVLAMGEDVNILVMDTEVYSNTGGQASKATPMSAIAKFASKGKRIHKKDLGQMAMSYGYVYTASVSLMAKPAQTLKAFAEAVAYNGPSIILSYAPCIEHGIKRGLAAMAEEQKLVVDSGYWPLYRYNPENIQKGESPLTLESKGVNEELLREILVKENRYNRLTSLDPEHVEALHAELVRFAKFRYSQLESIANIKLT